MHKLTIYIMLMVSPFTFLLGQDNQNYKQVDSLTYQYYQNKNWTKLLEVGKTAIKQDYDFYYLHVRMGIAYYKQQAYNRAIGSFKKSLKKNSTAELPNEYLYLCYLYIGESEIAEYYYFKLNTSTLSRYTEVKKFKLIENIGVEGGFKVSTADTIGDMYYGSFSLSTKLHPKFRLNQSYQVLSQATWWGSYVQHQYYLNPQVYLNKGVSIVAGFNFTALNGSFNYDTEHLRQDTFYIFSPPPLSRPLIENVTDEISEEYTGDINDKAFMGYLGYKHSINRVKYSIGATMLSYQSTINQETQRVSNSTHTIKTPLGVLHDEFSRDTSFVNPFDTSFTIIQFQPQASIVYTLPFANDRLNIGLFGAVTINENSTGYLANPWLTIRAGKKVWLKFDYYSSDASYAADYGGSQINNTVDLLKQRFGTTIDWHINDKINWYNIFRLEKREDNSINLNYNFIAFFTGINIKL